jgi:hypothetical protein
MDEQPYTSADFQDDVHRQLVAATLATLSDNKLSPSQVAPFLDAARALCRDDVRLNGRLAVHGVEFQGADLVDADEAYLSLSVRDRDEGAEWLSQTYWLSDLALADQDLGRVRGTIAALERSIARLKDWLEAREPEAAEGAGEAEPAPPTPSD